MRIALASLGLVVVGLVAGCRVSADAKASTSTGVQANAESDSFNASAPPSSSAPTPPPEPPAAPPPPSEPGCPLACYAPSGAAHFAVTPTEMTQLTSALQPAFARMRSCKDEGTSGLEYDQHGNAVRRWHRSPVINLRIAPDGTLEDLGVDPGHGYSEQCMDAAARDSTTTLSLPGRTTVRCHEQCVAPHVDRAPKAAVPGPRTRKKTRAQ